MKYLACPDDKSELYLDVPKRDEVVEGRFQCRECSKEFEIWNGSVNFLGPGKREYDPFLSIRDGRRTGFLIDLMQDAADRASKVDEKKSAEIMQEATRQRYDCECYSGTWKIPQDIIKELKPYTSGLIIEGACGPGEGLIKLRENIDCDFYIGIDISGKMVRKAQENARRLNRKGNRANMLFVQGDIRYLPLTSGMTKIYMVNNAWDRVAQPRKAAEEGKRILSEDGSVIFSNCQPLQYESQDAGKNIINVPREERITLEEAVGLADCKPVLIREGYIWTVKTLLDGLENLPMKVVYGVRR